MGNVESMKAHLEPVRLSITVPRSVEEAFRLFTEGIARWWPKDQYSVSRERTRDVILEPRVGGSVHEVRDDGETFPWGKVLVWEAPARLVLAWHPGHEPQVAQEVEVRFQAADGGTRVDLEHRDWSKLGDGAAKVREGYVGGWAVVLGEHFVKACHTE